MAKIQQFKANPIWRHISRQLLLMSISLTMVACVTEEREESPKGTPLLRLPDQGCPMAHCSPQMNDHAGSDAPLAPTSAIQWQVESKGSSFGLGCASNGSLVACSGKKPGLQVINAEGNVEWQSTVLDESAYTSAPIIYEDGTIIAADQEHIVRFNADGSIKWLTKTSGGLGISPVPTEDGNAIALALSDGGVDLFDLHDGELIASRILKDAQGQIYGTRNTPCIAGDRIYVSTDATDDQSRGAIFALDAATLDILWSYPFRGPSGASPTCIDNAVVFDGAGSRESGEAAKVYAIENLQNPTPTLRFSVEIEAAAKASLAPDPRGGLWYFTLLKSSLTRISKQDGKVLQRIDLAKAIDAKGGSLLADAAYPSSATTIIGSADPIMLLGARAGGIANGVSYAVALALTTGQSLWKVEIPDTTASQFAIIRRENKSPLAVFPTLNSGPIAIGAAQ